MDPAIAEIDVVQEQTKRPLASGSAACACGRRVRHDDTFCSSCGRTLKWLRVTPSAVTVVTIVGEGHATLVLANNEGQDGGDLPVNPVLTKLSLSGDAAEHITISQENGEFLRDNASVIVPAGGTITLRLVADVPDDTEFDFLCEASVDSDDPKRLPIRVPIAVTEEPPQCEWIGEDQQPITGRTVKEARFRASQGGGSQPVPIGVRVRNGGGGYLVIGAIEVDEPYRSAVEIVTPTRHIARHGEAELTVKVRPAALPDGTSHSIPLHVEFPGVGSQSVIVDFSLTQPGILTAWFPSFKQRGDGRWHLDCTPYGRRDFVIELRNVGGEPTTLTAVTFDRTDIARIFKGGYEQLSSGTLTPPLVVNPKEKLTAIKLSVDLQRLTFDPAWGGVESHEVLIRFETQPGGVVLEEALVFDVKRKELGHELPSYIGLDFGTSNSTVAIGEFGAGGGERIHQVLRMDDGGSGAPGEDAFCLKSVLFFRGLDDPLIGEAALSVGQSKPENYLRSFKRLIGLKCPRCIQDHELTPEDLAEIIFARLIQRASNSSRVKRFSPFVVATCPANFSNNQMTSVRRACRRALLKMMLHVYADKLQARLRTKYQAIAEDVSATLDTIKGGRNTLDLIARAMKREQPVFGWDVNEPAHCLLLLAYLAVNGGLLEPNGGEPLDLRREEGLVSRLASALLVPFETTTIPGTSQPLVGFSGSPTAALVAWEDQAMGALRGDLYGYCVDWVSDVLQSASMMDVRMLDEPTAAAHAYLLVNRPRLEEEDIDREYIAVFDFGGGTFDVSVVAVERAVAEPGGGSDEKAAEEAAEPRDEAFPGEVVEEALEDEERGFSLRVVHTDGISELGGDELDVALVKHFLESAQVSSASRELLMCSVHDLPELVRSRFAVEDNPHDVMQKTLVAKRLLKETAESAKIRISIAQRAALDQGKSEDEISIALGSNLSAFEEPALPGEMRTIEGSLTWSDLEGIFSPVVERTVRKFRDVLEVARQRERDEGRTLVLNRVLLAGMSSRLPLVTSMLLSEPKLELTEAMLDMSLRGEEKACVAIGASYYGTIDAGGSERVTSSTRILTRSIGVARPLHGVEIFDALPGLERGRVFDSTSKHLAARLRVPYKQFDHRCVAENVGSSRQLVIGGVVNPEITRIGMFVWGCGEIGSRGDQINIDFKLDANGILAVSGSYKGRPIGQYKPLALTLAERPVYVFI